MTPGRLAGGRSLQARGGAVPGKDPGLAGGEPTGGSPARLRGSRARALGTRARDGSPGGRFRARGQGSWVRIVERRRGFRAGGPGLLGVWAASCISVGLSGLGVLPCLSPASHLCVPAASRPVPAAGQAGVSTGQELRFGDQLRGSPPSSCLPLTAWLELPAPHQVMCHQGGWNSSLGICLHIFPCWSRLLGPRGPPCPFCTLGPVCLYTPQAHGAAVSVYRLHRQALGEAPEAGPQGWRKRSD